MSICIGEESRPYPSNKALVLHFCLVYEVLRAKVKNFEGVRVIFTLWGLVSTLHKEKEVLFLGVNAYRHDFGVRVIVFVCNFNDAAVIGGGNFDDFLALEL